MSTRNERRTLSVHEIHGPERTLAYGFTSDKGTWHCYLDGANIHVLVYRRSTNSVVSHLASPTWNVAELAPDKRVYPESVDAEFARLLLERGQDLPYTRFDDKRHAPVAELTFHGAVYDPDTAALVQADPYA
ncbi:hypothetical protein [Streptomyces sp. OfavH-34-F]|uniref:hypothetical protein n=1 Tax=Streptomyces sp. OfavH-34-F TaxID=2917760 RepID=UPI001EF1C42A|nr:hypothetical protein [Streptomyces sp. OfavH-34-F]